MAIHHVKDWAKIDRRTPKQHFYSAKDLAKPIDVSEVQSFRLWKMALERAVELKGCFVCVMMLNNRIDPHKPKLLILVGTTQSKVVAEKKNFSACMVSWAIFSRREFLGMRYDD